MSLIDASAMEREADIWVGLFIAADVLSHFFFCVQAPEILGRCYAANLTETVGRSALANGLHIARA